MTGSTSPDQPTRRATSRRYGPAVGEPPLWADPRRWGSLIGLLGGLVFIGSYSPALGGAASIIAWVAGLALVLVALSAHYVWPVPLGPLVRPRPLALGIYCAAVVGALAVINLSSRALEAAGHGNLRPALIAAVVGVHFIPFAWAFGERMFFWLGGLVAALGAVGVAAGFMGVPHAAEALAVVAGLTMQVIIALYARGRFALRSSSRPHSGAGVDIG